MPRTIHQDGLLRTLTLFPSLLGSLLPCAFRSIQQTLAHTKLTKPLLALSRLDKLRHYQNQLASSAAIQVIQQLRHPSVEEEKKPFRTVLCDTVLPLAPSSSCFDSSGCHTHRDEKDRETRDCPNHYRCCHGSSELFGRVSNRDRHSGQRKCSNDGEKATELDSDCLLEREPCPLKSHIAYTIRFFHLKPHAGT